MTTPQMLNDIASLLIQLAPPLALVTLLLAGIALRSEGGSTFVIGGGFNEMDVLGNPCAGPLARCKFT